jgi:PKD repeat protein
MIAQQTCNPDGNLVIFSNIQGGHLIINVTMNIPNLKIGVCSEDPVLIEVVGNYASNVKGLCYAGRNELTNNNCLYGFTQTNVIGVPPQFVEVLTKPMATFLNPFGNDTIIGATGICSVNLPAGGYNTPDQIVEFFENRMGATLFKHDTQIQCWDGSDMKLEFIGNCCATPDPNGVVEAAFITNDSVVCAGSCVKFINTSTGGPFSQVAWQFPGGSPSFSTEDEPIVCFDEPGIYSVSLLVTRGEFTNVLSLPGYLTVLANDSINPTFSYVTPICTGSGVQTPLLPADFTLSGIFSSSTLLVDSVTGTFDVNGLSEGNYSVTYTIPSESQCFTGGSNQFTFNFSLQTTPSISTTPSGQALYCVGYPLTLTAENGFTNYSWNIENGESQSVQITETGSFIVSAIASNGCFAQSEPVNVISVMPEPFSISPDIEASFCQDGSLTIFASPGFQQYTWSNGFTGPILEVSIPGVYSVSVNDVNGCTLTKTVNISQINNPSANFTHSQTISLVIDFANTSSFATSYLWKFGDGQTSTDVSPSHEYADNGSYLVTLIASNECGSDTISFSVEVFKLSIANTHVLPFKWSSTSHELVLFDIKQASSIEIFSISGSRVHSEVVTSEGQMTINVNHLNSGLYLARLVAGEKNYTFRFFKP